MYRIVNAETGAEIGYTADIRYIRSNNGVFVSAKKEDATGISFNSVPYSLYGTDGIEDLPVVGVFEVDTSAKIHDVASAIDILLGVAE